MTATPLSSLSPERPITHTIDGWTCVTLQRIPSTNDYARGLSEWNAVRAEEQTSGRGRHGRTWEAKRGGVWLSAVIPTRESAPWEFLPLLAGLTVIETLHDIGVRNLRLRWPNDVMHDSRKLAGILVEKPSPEKAVIGIGLNVFNRPTGDAFELEKIAISLSELIDTPPNIEEITNRILHALSRRHQAFVKGGIAPLIADLQGHWGQPRRVCCHLDDGEVTGLFGGVDEVGHLRIFVEEGHQRILPATKVKLLTEETF